MGAGVEGASPPRRDARDWELWPLRGAIEEALLSGNGQPEMIALGMLAELVAEFPEVVPSAMIDQGGHLTWVLGIVRDYFSEELPRFTRGPGQVVSGGSY